MNGADTALRTDLHRLFSRQPDWYIALGEKLKLLRAGAWPEDLVDCVFQYDWHHDVDIFDLWVFLNVYSRLQGHIAVFSIPMDCEPYPDKAWSQNTEALGRMPEPFSGTFWGGTQGEDGTVKWSVPVHATLWINHHIEWLLLKAADVPLEVGYNSAGKFLEALSRRGTVARWPYGQRKITVFANLDLAPHFGSDSTDFRRALAESGKTIACCIDQRQRNPWPAWNEGYPARQSISDGQ